MSHRTLASFVALGVGLKRMIDFTDWLVIKLLFLVVAAFCYGFWREITALPRQEPRQEDHAAIQEDQTADQEARR